MKISHCSPVVYRFMKEEYIDSFFKNGELQLSTLSICKDTKGLREDDEEGEYQFYFKGDEGTIGVNCSIGGNAYLLSTALSFAALHNEEHNYCIEFRDVDVLANIVADRLQVEHDVKVKEIVVGPCNYSERMRTIDLPKGMTFADIGLRKGEFPDEDEFIDEYLFNSQLRTKFGDRVCFTKPARLLAEQEYRIMWVVDDIVEDPIKVHVPSPEKYATKIRAIKLITKEEKDRFLEILSRRNKSKADELSRELLRRLSRGTETLDLHERKVEERADFVG